MYRILELNTGKLLHETTSLDKAKRWAELYKLNMGKDSSIQRCETVWTSQTLGDILNA